MLDRWGTIPLRDAPTTQQPPPPRGEDHLLRLAGRGELSHGGGPRAGSKIIPFQRQEGRGDSTVANPAAATAEGVVLPGGVLSGQAVPLRATARSNRCGGPPQRMGGAGASKIPAQ